MAEWRRQSLGGGEIADEGGIVRLAIPCATTAAYADAEIHDYATSRRSDFLWRPPVQMRLRARASHPAAQPDRPGAECLRGTAGFGFWNASLGAGIRGPRLPDAVWFFYASPPSNMQLVPELPGYGWKAQVVHANRAGAFIAAPPTALAVAWARVSGQTAPAARWVQRLAGAHEAIITADLASWHDYRLEWRPDAATFFVDDRLICTAPHPPRGPLGFIAWCDTQFAIATPRGEIRFGLLATGPEWLELADLAIAPLE